MSTILEFLFFVGCCFLAGVIGGFGGFITVKLMIAIREGMI